MNDNRVPALKSYIEKMPSLPTTVTKIMEICNDPRTSPADLNRVISLDPVLMGKVMRLINSAYYGLSQEITSLVRAIIMLGINTVKNLALSTAILGTLGNKADFQALNMDGFWRHSLGVGVTAKLIAKHRKVDPKTLEEYFIAGLLHDIGKIPLNNRFPQDYVAAMGISDRDNSPLFAAESEMMGLNHAQVGDLILKAWNLDESIQDVVLHHHKPEGYKGPHKEKLYTVVLANYFANDFEIGFSGDRYPSPPHPGICQALKVTMETLEDMEDQVKQEIERASIFLKLAK
jgi:putative nucleotidyltransferase with HDIG domain